MNPLKNPWYSALTGLILALILAAILSTGTGNPIEWTVWFHVVVGIMWIGLLYYFNFVQVPAVNAALADGDPGPAAINKYVAPKALWFFRWAALLTWLSGAAALWKLGILHQAFTFAEGTRAIGIGAWLGTIMLFNVWVLIWPNQKKLLGFTPASDEEKAKAKIVALYASRTNTILSIPMLMGMTASHYHNGGLPF
jgi:uncharacterized membrane protein